MATGPDGYPPAVTELTEQPLLRIDRLDDGVLLAGWWWEYVATQGVASEHGQELGGADAGGAPADDDAAVDYVVARALDVSEEQGGALDSVAVVVALDLLGVYLREMGAIGGPVGDRD